MLKKEYCAVFEAYEIFQRIREKFGEDVEGQFNEIYCPPAEGAILFIIPDTNEEYDEFELYEKYVADILMSEGGLTWGDKCYIHFDY